MPEVKEQTAEKSPKKNTLLPLKRLSRCAESRCVLCAFFCCRYGERLCS